jgi:AcrR family transcriptional regulator
MLVPLTNNLYRGGLRLPRQDRAERTRNLILDAAAEAFDARGFVGASLSDILARAGVTKGALYFHFSSKEELAKALIEEQWNIELPELDNTTNPIQSVIDLCHSFCHSLCSNIRVRASNRLVTESNFDRPYPQVYSRWNDIIHQFLKIAQDSGDLRQELDPEEVATFIGGSVFGIQTMSGVLTNREDLRERLTAMWKISLPGIVPARRLSRFHPGGTIQWDTTAA